MIYRREGMRHQCWSLVIVSTERGRQVGDEVLHHGLPRSRESPVYRRGHGESVFACASTLVRRGEYRAQTEGVGRRVWKRSGRCRAFQVTKLTSDNLVWKTCACRLRCGGVRGQLLRPSASRASTLRERFLLPSQKNGPPSFVGIGN
jgi:hypothetical protein